MRQDPTWFTALGLCIADKFSERRHETANILGEFFKPMKQIFSEIIKQLIP